MSEKSWEKRTRYCGTIRSEDKGEEVILNGWVQRRRDHGGVIFVDLRDVTGIVQVVFNPEISEEAHAVAEQLRGEFVLSCRGKVRSRPQESINPGLPTGEVEVMADKAAMITASQTPPFEIKEGIEVDEALRLRYRYLDLRRPVQRKAFILRSRVMGEVRNYLQSQSFLEIETPMLTKSTPEGARDFIVPSRLQPGRFYALPQSPQLFKQLLMVAGFDRYYQIVRCFRDEDMRADRQLEFTQVDLEMSFVEPSDIIQVIEGMFVHVFGEVLEVELKAPFPRMTWQEAMDRYGTDAPDTRLGMELKDFTDIYSNSEFKVFRSAIDKGGKVRGFKVEGLASPPRSELDGLVDEAVRLGASGLIWMVREGEEVKSPISKFLTDAEVNETLRRAELGQGEVVVLAAGSEEISDVLAGMRKVCARRFSHHPTEGFSFVWVTDFPLFEWDEEEKRHKSVHHPFTSPSPQCMEFLDERPLVVTSDSYDIVLNGEEIGGGSIRIHDPEVQDRVFRILGLGKEEAQEKFGFLMEAFKYGPPPHGGIALGLDRIVMIMAGLDSIREVIAFPKTQSGIDLLTGAPDTVYSEQLKELRLRPT
jgi:aspartyl-tRNA synthetase